MTITTHAQYLAFEFILEKGGEKTAEETYKEIRTFITEKYPESRVQVLSAHWSDYRLRPDGREV